ncbi:Fungal transcriptional regulatory [Cordyceps militaris]|uniref:Fungal transcriptional regulatory n=1 Tax=Cordyceps militaris TaxID=73501 RepID=A0A2H4SAD6_CORMI|nr:Fungal transcriptional regulatory [Cordyceps militaris]
MQELFTPRMMNVAPPSLLSHLQQVRALSLAFASTTYATIQSVLRNWHNRAMFANFELWSGGLVDYAAKKRQPRSKTGCISCRRIKKKCDEARPVCGRCLQRGHTRCTWTCEPLRAVVVASSTPESCMRERQRPPRSRADEYDDSSFPSIRPSSSFLVHFREAGLAGVVPAAHAWEVVCHANRAVHGAYFDDHYTILVPLLPLLAEFPSYAYTWLALGAAQLAQQQPSSSDSSPWRLTALKCHSKAVSGLRRHLASSPVPQEWALCCVLLLHIFEKFGDGQQQRWPSDAHVKSARGYFLHRFVECPPTSMRHMLQLESLIYRIAVTSLFRPREDCCCTFLDRFVDIWAAASSSIRCGGLWRHSLWIGLPPSTFNAVFKLSVLLRQVPLNAPQRAELQRVEEHLPAAHLPPRRALLPGPPGAHRERGGRPALTLDEQSHAAHCLFTSACWIVLAKTRPAAPTQDQERIRELALSGCGWLDCLIQAEFFSPVLLWPVIIIGLAAATVQEQNTATAYVNALAHTSGPRASTSVTRLFKTAWEGVNGAEPAGLDMLFDSEALATVFI